MFPRPEAKTDLGVTGNWGCELKPKRNGFCVGGDVFAKKANFSYQLMVPIAEGATQCLRVTRQCLMERIVMKQARQWMMTAPAMKSSVALLIVSSDGIQRVGEGFQIIVKNFKEGGHGERPKIAPFL